MDVKKFVIAIVALGLAVALPVAAVALPGVEPGTPVTNFSIFSLLDSLKNLAGVAMFISVAINILKTVGLVKDGQAPAWATGMNLVVLIGMFIAQVTGYGDTIPLIDEQFGMVSNVASVVFAFIFQLFVTRQTHVKVLSGTPGIGKSFTLERIQSYQDLDDEDYE